MPTVVVRVTDASGAVSPRRRRRRARPYNPRRHLEFDDYVPAHLLTPPRTPSPPFAPIRKPLAPRSRVRELDRRQQDRGREIQERCEERVRRDLPARPARELAVSPTERARGERMDRSPSGARPARVESRVTSSRPAQPARPLNGSFPGTAHDKDARNHVWPPGAYPYGSSVGPTP